jgi:GMP synthase-like glutamine amidotransferase
VFAEAVAAAGHQLEEWSLAWDTPLPRPLDDYGAVLVFGGAMHADQDDGHPWLREENLFLQRLLDRHVPVLGVCLGAQLLAQTSFSGVTSGVAQVKAFEQALASAQVSYESNKLGLEVGVRTNLDVLNQQQQVFQTRFNLTQSYYNFLISQLKLKQAVGTLTDADLEQINRDLRV